jgi:hypothetical protein
MTTLIPIKSLDGICGAGKTYAIAEWADRMANAGQKVLLVQPTTKLVHETISTTFPVMRVTARVRAITLRRIPGRLRRPSQPISLRPTTRAKSSSSRTLRSLA